MKRVRIRYLDVALVDSGPKGAPTVLLLHGWPDDATTWARIAPRPQRRRLPHRGPHAPRLRAHPLSLRAYPPDRQCRDLSIMLHSYRSRWGEAPLDRRSLKLEAKVKATRRLAVPALFLQGGADRVSPPAASEKMGTRYARSFERIVLDGVGHFLPREMPNVVTEHLLRHFRAG